MTSDRIPSKLVTGNFGKLKITLSPFTYVAEHYGDVVVPAGFIFDGASIPRFAWSLLGVTPYDPKIICAAVVHDWLYNSKTKSKREADNIFYYIMYYQGFISKAKIKIMYSAVKAFGDKAYNKKHKDVEFLCPKELINYIS